MDSYGMPFERGGKGATTARSSTTNVTIYIWRKHHHDNEPSEHHSLPRMWRCYEFGKRRMLAMLQVLG